MIHSVRAYDGKRSNFNHFFALHRETESQVSSDADLEHPDGKNAETGKSQVFDFFLPRGDDDSMFSDLFVKERQIWQMGII